MYKSRGNWAEDLGHDIGCFMWAALIGLPVAAVVIVALVIMLVVKW